MRPTGADCGVRLPVGVPWCWLIRGGSRPRGFALEADEALGVGQEPAMPEMRSSCGRDVAILVALKTRLRFRWLWRWSHVGRVHSSRGNACYPIELQGHELGWPEIAFTASRGHAGCHEERCSVRAIALGLPALSPTEAQDTAPSPRSEIPPTRSGRQILALPGTPRALAYAQALPCLLGAGQPVA